MNATCSRCGESHAVTTYPSINVAQDPDLKARVRDGSLFVWECPHCGARNLLKYQTLYPIAGPGTSSSTRRCTMTRRRS